MRELSVRGYYDAIILVGGSSESHKEIKEGRTKLNVDDVFPLPQLESDPAIDDIIEPLKTMIRRYQGRNLILVSLGLPKQELFCRKLMNSGILDCNKDFILPVGAAIDFATGRRVRSSQVWTNLGLEWLPRLLREPRMLPRIFRSLRAVYYILVSQMTRAT